MSRDDTTLDRRTVLRTVSGSVVSTGIIGAVSGSAAAGSAQELGRSRFVQVTMTHELHGDVPVTETDRFVFPTYMQGDTLYYVGTEASSYTPGAVTARTPLGISQTRGRQIGVTPGGVVEADDGGSYARIIAVDGYETGEIPLRVSDRGVSVSPDGSARQIPRGQTRQFELSTRTVEVPQFEERRVSDQQGDTTRENRVNVQTGTTSVSVTPTVSVTDHGAVSVVGREGARVFPATMPGADAIWHNTDSANRERSDGIITIWE